MPYGINTVTVIGAGTMGAAIAGHFANAGLNVNLLDLAPSELTPADKAAGLTLEDPRVRNRIVQSGFQRMIKSKPSNLYVPEVAERIRLGNLEDDLDRAVQASQWVIEAIVERLEPKQALMGRIQDLASADCIVSTNTSGIPVHLIGRGLDESFRRRFLGTHFFNPPRYLHLLEIIPTDETASEVVERVRTFAENVLGKGVVVCKDTPNFVANRLLSYIQSHLMEYAIANGYTVEEVDRLTGPLLGRPKTGTFRLNDVVGIDVMAMVAENLHEMIPHDDDRQVLLGERGKAVTRTLVEHGLLGSKSGQGFYKTVVDEEGNKSFWGLDLQTAAEGEVAYVEPVKPRWTSVGEARDLPLDERLRILVHADDPAGKLIWATLSHTLAYASKRIPEIADSIVDIDNAMKWGFGWEMGPFEMWDALDVVQTLKRMEAEGINAAPWVHTMVDAGRHNFYTVEGTERCAYGPQTESYHPIDEGPRARRLAYYRRANPPLGANESATLLEMGDGVLLLEFHSKMNALDTSIFEIMEDAVARLHRGATGLVIGNEGANFSVGANIMLLGMAAQAGRWDELEKMIRAGQDTFMALRKAPVPVVAAPFQRVLGGGVEVCLAADRMVAHAESYIGLVEVGVGIVPGWGGCKEMVRRVVSPHMVLGKTDPTPYLRRLFETIGYAKVSTSAAEAKTLGFLSTADPVIMNRDHLLAAARDEVLHIAEQGYSPPETTGTVFAAGRDVLSGIRVEIYSLREAGYISTHDATIADRLGAVLCGGDLSAPSWMDEQYFLDLEREAVLSLAGEAKTQARIWHMLQTGRPLRN